MAARLSHHRLRRGLKLLAGIVGVYLLVAYVLLPFLWTEHERHHPALDNAPKVTVNGQGIPGDALNAALIGDKALLIRAMLAAGWKPADPITLRSSLEIAESVVLDRPDLTAPVSPLYLYGRPQDMAFEQEVPTGATMSAGGAPSRPTRMAAPCGWATPTSTATPASAV